MKISSVIYADLESLLKEICTCHKNLEVSSTIKINENTTSGSSLFTQYSFDTTKNKLDY